MTTTPHRGDAAQAPAVPHEPLRAAIDTLLACVAPLLAAFPAVTTPVLFPRLHNRCLHQHPAYRPQTARIPHFGGGSPIRRPHEKVVHSSPAHNSRRATSARSRSSVAVSAASTRASLPAAHRRQFDR